MKPISPDEISPSIPDFVIEAVNDLLKEKYRRGSEEVVLTQDEVVTAILSAAVSGCTLLSRDTIFKKGWLNFEPLYQKNGWEVSYDKPGFNETYKATYTFTKKPD
jgi:hypothetical protein